MSVAHLKMATFSHYMFCALCAMHSVARPITRRSKRKVCVLDRFWVTVWHMSMSPS